MPINHALIHRIGWRQGSVLSVRDSTLLLNNTPRPQPAAITLPPATKLIVASHSCDVVSPSELEINCEFCPALPLAPGETSGLFGYGRDPRRLRLPIQIDGNSVLHEMYAPLRFPASRNGLEQIQPDPAAHIREDDLLTFEFWLAARNSRRVFPNSFDQRLDTKNHKRIRKALVPVEPHVLQLLYSLSPQRELTDENDTYRLSVVLLVQSTSMRDQTILAQLEAARDRIEEILEDRRGIASTVSLVGDETMTYSNMRMFSRWGFEDLSLEAGTENKL